MKIDSLDKKLFMSQFGEDEYKCPRCRKHMRHSSNSTDNTYETYSCSNDDYKHIVITFSNSKLEQLSCYATKKSYIYFVVGTMQYPLIYVGAGCQYLLQDQSDFSIRNIMKIEKELLDKKAISL